MTINAKNNNIKKVDQSVRHLDIDPFIPVCDYTKSLLELKYYEPALTIMLICSSSKDHIKKLCNLNLEVLKKLNDKKNAIIGYINALQSLQQNPIKYLKTFKDLIEPLVKTLKPDGFIKDFYTLKQTKPSARIKCATLLLLLNKYEVMEDMINKVIAVKEEESKEFNIFVFTIKLTMLFKLEQEMEFETNKLAGFYIEYIKQIKNVPKKEKTVSNFIITIFKLYSSGKANQKNIQIILDMLESQEEVPFNNILRNIWICISEPNTVEAQRYLNEKPIAAIVNEIKKDPKGWT